jgi:hypothetical protein
MKTLDNTDLALRIKIEFRWPGRAVVFAYLALLVFSLGVPLLHYCHTDRVIESMRPAIQMEDGSFSPMLMPAHILLLRWLGQLSSFVPIGICIAFVLSFWRESFGRFSVICFIAICQCAFTTIYALYSSLLLGVQ